MSIHRVENKTISPSNELREQIKKELDAKFKMCSNPTYHCSLPRLDNCKYCFRHILHDPQSNYRQCTFIYKNGRKCTNAYLKNDTKKDPALTTFCFEHSRKTQLQKTRASIGQLRKADTNEAHLQSLAHHIKINETVEKAPTYDQDEEIDVVSPQVTPFVPYESVHTLEGVDAASRKKRRILEYASDSSGDEEPIRLFNRRRGYEYDNSDNESGYSDTEDVLRHNGIFAREEAVRISIRKLTRLQGLYMEQLNRLHYVLKDERRRYLQGIRKERERHCSIHEQAKDSPRERITYEKLKALTNYHRRFGAEVVLHKKFLDKRSRVTEKYTNPYHSNYNYGQPHKGRTATKCIYTEGGVKCAERTVPCTKFCRKHILEDKKQIFFQQCGVEKNGVVCQTSIPTIFDGATCILHLTPPIKKQYAQKKYDSETDDDEVETSSIRTKTDIM